MQMMRNNMNFQNTFNDSISIFDDDNQWEVFPNFLFQSKSISPNSMSLHVCDAQEEEVFQYV